MATLRAVTTQTPQWGLNKEGPQNRVKWDLSLQPTPSSRGCQAPAQGNAMDEWTYQVKQIMAALGNWNSHDRHLTFLAKQGNKL